jgi:hypothetical protein
MIILLIAFAAASPAGAEVVRLPPLALASPFSTERAVLPGAETWGDYRWYATEDRAPELGTDFELGTRAALYTTPAFALTGFVRLLYQSRHLEEYDNPFVFSPRHLTTDLRLIAYGRIDPVVVYGGWRHDCTHAVDAQDVRTPIHDVLLVGVRSPAADIPWRHAELSSTAEASLEGEINVPAAFTDRRDLVDRGRISAGLRAEPVRHARYGALFLDGTVSVIVRETDTTAAENIERVNLDWGAAVGYRTPGKGGTLSVYLRVERLTDPWIAEQLEPVTVTGIGALLHMR